MISMTAYIRGIRDYPVIEPLQVLADIRARIAALPEEPSRRTATAALAQVRDRLQNLDLRDCGWPPQSGRPGQPADLLHADTQKLVSAVLRVDHGLRRITILKYVLKVKR